MTQQFPDPHGTYRTAAPGLLDRLGLLGRRKVAAYVGGGAVALVLLCCGGLGAVGALSGDPQGTTDSSGDRPVGVAAAPAGPPTETDTETGTEATPTAEPIPTRAERAEVTAAPAVRTRTVTETRAIAFKTRTIRDSSLPEGTRKVRTKGVAGVRTLTYEVTYTDGVETSRRLLRQQVTRPAVTKVVALGTKPTRRCDPNYSGCVPVASDVDCAGGSGDGPAYVSGPVRVTGTDIYRLDHDKDGYGCE